MPDAAQSILGARGRNQQSSSLQGFEFNCQRRAKQVSPEAGTRRVPVTGASWKVSIAMGCCAVHGAEDRLLDVFVAEAGSMD